MPKNYFELRQLEVHPKPAFQRFRPHILTIKDHPEMLLRDEVTKENDGILEDWTTFAEQLIKLDEHYGIKSPGYSLTRAFHPESGELETFALGYRLEGTDFIKLFHPELYREQPLASPQEAVPIEAVVHGLGAIASYYTYVVNEGGRYLTDFKPGDLMWGSQPPDTEKHTYFVDFDSVNQAACTGTGPHQLARRACTSIKSGLWATEQAEEMYGARLGNLKAIYNSLLNTQQQYFAIASKITFMVFYP